MGVVRESIEGLKPLIFVCWIVAALRVVVEASTTDLNTVAMLSVYATVVIVFMFCGFTGSLDRLVWKPLLVGSVVLGISCWFVPNLIAYSVAQFRGWNHGRFYNDPEHYAIQKREMDKGVGFWDAKAKSVEELKRPDPTRGPPIADTTAGKLQTALTVATFTTIPGILWSLVFGVLLVGIPASIRRRRSG